MALKATIFKADLAVADMDRAYYATHALTVARHPSETDERMMVRLVAFALFASDGLRFGRGLSSEEPELQESDLTGAITAWIDVGLPDEKRIRRACGRAGAVHVLAYGGHAAELWWKQIASDVERFDNLAVWNIPRDATRSLATFAARTMSLQCTIQEGQVWLGCGDDSVTIEPQQFKKPGDVRK